MNQYNNNFNINTSNNMNGMNTQNMNNSTNTQNMNNMNNYNMNSMNTQNINTQNMNSMNAQNMNSMNTQNMNIYNANNMNSMTQNMNNTNNQNLNINQNHTHHQNNNLNDYFMNNLNDLQSEFNEHHLTPEQIQQKQQQEMQKKLLEKAKVYFAKNPMLNEVFEQQNYQFQVNFVQMSDTLSENPQLMQYNINFRTQYQQMQQHLFQQLSFLQIQKQNQLQMQQNTQQQQLLQQQQMSQIQQHKTSFQIQQPVSNDQSKSSSMNNSLQPQYNLSQQNSSGIHLQKNEEIYYEYLFTKLTSTSPSPFIKIDSKVIAGFIKLAGLSVDNMKKVWSNCIKQGQKQVNYDEFCCLIRTVQIIKENPNSNLYTFQQAKNAQINQQNMPLFEGYKNPKNVISNDDDIFSQNLNVDLLKHQSSNKQQQDDDFDDFQEVQTVPVQNQQINFNKNTNNNKQQSKYDAFDDDLMSTPNNTNFNQTIQQSQQLNNNFNNNIQQTNINKNSDDFDDFQDVPNTQNTQNVQINNNQQQVNNLNDGFDDFLDVPAVNNNIQTSNNKKDSDEFDDFQDVPQQNNNAYNTQQSQNKQKQSDDFDDFMDVPQVIVQNQQNNQEKQQNDDIFDGFQDATQTQKKDVKADDDDFDDFQDVQQKQESPQKNDVQPIDNKTQNVQSKSTTNFGGFKVMGPPGIKPKNVQTVQVQKQEEQPKNKSQLESKNQISLLDDIIDCDTQVNNIQQVEQKQNNLQSNKKSDDDDFGDFEDVQENKQDNLNKIDDFLDMNVMNNNNINAQQQNNNIIQENVSLGSSQVQNNVVPQQTINNPLQSSDIYNTNNNDDDFGDWDDGIQNNNNQPQTFQAPKIKAYELDWDNIENEMGIQKKNDDVVIIPTIEQPYVQSQNNDFTENNVLPQKINPQDFYSLYTQEQLQGQNQEQQQNQQEEQKSNHSKQEIDDDFGDFNDLPPLQQQQSSQIQSKSQIEEDFSDFKDSNIQNEQNLQQSNISNQQIQQSQDQEQDDYDFGDFQDFDEVQPQQNIQNKVEISQENNNNKIQENDDDDDDFGDFEDETNNQNENINNEQQQEEQIQIQEEQKEEQKPAFDIRKFEANVFDISAVDFGQDPEILRQKQEQNRLKLLEQQRIQEEQRIREEQLREQELKNRVQWEDQGHVVKESQYWRSKVESEVMEYITDSQFYTEIIEELKSLNLYDDAENMVQLQFGIETIKDIQEQINNGGQNMQDLQQQLSDMEQNYQNTILETVTKIYECDSMSVMQTIFECVQTIPNHGNDLSKIIKNAYLQSDDKEQIFDKVIKAGYLCLFMGQKYDTYKKNIEQVIENGISDLQTLKKTIENFQEQDKSTQKEIVGQPKFIQHVENISIIFQHVLKYCKLADQLGFDIDKQFLQQYLKNHNQQIQIINNNLNTTLSTIQVKKDDDGDNWKNMKEEFIKFIIFRGSLSGITGFTCSLCFQPLCNNKLNYRGHFFHPLCINYFFHKVSTQIDI